MQSAPLTPEQEEKRRKSNRLAFTILGGAVGCGCLWMLFAMAFGFFAGMVSASRQPEPVGGPIYRQAPPR